MRFRSKSADPSRPPRLLLVVLILLCVENLVRVGLAVQQAVQLPALPTVLSPAYVAVTSAVWAVAYIACIAGVAWQRTWALRLTIGVVVLYQVYLWVTRLAFSRSPEVFATLGFRAILSTIMVLVVLALLGLWRLQQRTDQAAGR
jgi:hypothetical protein